MNASSINKKYESITSLKTAIPLVFKMVFLNRLYIVIAAAVFITFWIIFNVFDQLLFFTPVLAFYLPDDAAAGFIITSYNNLCIDGYIDSNE